MSSGISHAVDRYTEANNKYMKNVKTKKNHHVLSPVLKGTILEKVPVNDVKWVEQTFS